MPKMISQVCDLNRAVKVLLFKNGDGFWFSIENVVGDILIYANNL